MPDSETNTRRAPSIRRRLLAFAALILTPVVAGALISGLMLLQSASRSDKLGGEIVQESRASVALLQSLQAARLAGSGYMEEGEEDEQQERDAIEVRLDVGDGPVEGIRRQCESKNGYQSFTLTGSRFLGLADAHCVIHATDQFVHACWSR